MTTWTGEGTYTAAAASGAQTTTTTYDSPTHTYPTALQDALPGAHPPVSTSYDYLSGLPTAMTDLNGSTTTLVYDNFWRLWKVVRPGDTTNAVRGRFKGGDLGSFGHWGERDILFHKI